MNYSVIAKDFVPFKLWQFLAVSFTLVLYVELLVFYRLTEHLYINGLNVVLTSIVVHLNVNVMRMHIAIRGADITRKFLDAKNESQFDLVSASPKYIKFVKSVKSFKIAVLSLFLSLGQIVQIYAMDDTLVIAVATSLVLQCGILVSTIAFIRNRNALLTIDKIVGSRLARNDG